MCELDQGDIRTPVGITRSILALVCNSDKLLFSSNTERLTDTISKYKVAHHLGDKDRNPPHHQQRIP